MFKLILVTVLVGLAVADHINKDAEVQSYRNDPADAEGNYAYAFDTTNGISVQQSGNIAGSSGGAQWVSPEGVPVQFTYTADENGYHPSGDILPTPPPIPDAILRALEYIRTHPPKEVQVIQSVQNLPSRTVQSRTVQSRPVQSRPVQSRPIQSRPIQSRTNSYPTQNPYRG